MIKLKEGNFKLSCDFNSIEELQDIKKFFAEQLKEHRNSKKPFKKEIFKEFKRVMDIEIPEIITDSELDAIFKDTEEAFSSEEFQEKLRETHLKETEKALKERELRIKSGDEFDIKMSDDEIRELELEHELNELREKNNRNHKITTKKELETSSQASSNTNIYFTSNSPFSELEIYFVKEKKKLGNVKAGSFRAYSGTFNKLKEFFQNEPMKNIGRKRIEEFQDWLMFNKKTDKQVISSRTINDHITYTKNFFDFAIQKKVLTSNPCTTLNKLKIDILKQVKRENYTNKEVNEILNYKFDEKLYSDFFHVAFFTGMRLSEILYITNDNIKEEDGIKYIDLNYSKTINGIRKIPLHKVLLDRNISFPLSARTEEDKNNFELYKKREQQKIMRRLRKIIPKSSGKTIHTSRGTTISKLINNFTNSVLVIQDIVGHSKGKQSITIDRYGKGFNLNHKLEIINSISYNDKKELNNFGYDLSEYD